jgi:outer membrane protein assembly factor BamB
MKAITQHLFRRWKGILLVVTGLVVILAGIFIVFPRHPATYASASGDWPTYMFNVNRTGYNKAETVINRLSAPNLKVHWTAPAGGLVFSQPVTAGGVIYWGSFDGYEHATDLSGHEIWKANLGSRSNCAPLNPLGVVSSAAVVNGVVYVGGGDDNLYALNASNGSVIWKTPVGDPTTNTFVWDSPLVFNNTVYIGGATTGESTGCKLVRGLFESINASTGAIENTFYPVAAGCTGAGIWASPTFDTSTGAVYLSTGTEGFCGKGEAIGVIKLKLSTLAYQSSWVIPLADRVHDSDFGATPMFFVATINGTVHQMMGIPNKNGVFYAFDRTNISGGPLWTRPIANGGTCPQCAQGSIASSVFDGSKIYAAGGGTTTINGQSCKGSLRALSPVDGTFKWETCLSGTVMGAITMVPGVLAMVAGAHLTLVDSSTGTILYDVNPSQVTPSHTGSFYGSPTISNGVLYVGSTNGNLYAFGL